MVGILRSAFILVAAIAIIGGGTYSYFSTKESAIGTLSTGTLDIDLLKQNTSDSLQFTVSNMLPGDEKFVEFDVKNNSSEGVQIRGAAFGHWASVSGGVDTLMKVTKVERWNNTLSVPGWEVISSVSPVSGIFYDTNDGTSSGAYKTIGSGEKGQFRLTVELDPSTGDKYQGKTYDASVKVQARQVGASDWPADLDSRFE